jgi:hypothetical protein
MHIASLVTLSHFARDRQAVVIGRAQASREVGAEVVAELEVEERRREPAKDWNACAATARAQNEAWSVGRSCGMAAWRIDSASRGAMARRTS